ncbi:hypothetical protein QOT17_003162 [Balamuthia mandrillaris]
MLAILFAVHSFSNWLYSNKSMIYFDHKALPQLLGSPHLIIIHHPGIPMIFEDCLSQLYPCSFWDNGGLTPPSIPTDTPHLAQHKPRDLKALTLVDNSPTTVKSALNRHIKGRLNKQLPSTSEWKRLL